MRQHHRRALLTVSSAHVAVAPKCPICFLAYFGIFGVASASATAYRTWLAVSGGDLAYSYDHNTAIPVKGSSVLSTFAWSPSSSGGIRRKVFARQSGTCL